MNSRFLNKVKVVESFPGFKEGDVLSLNKSTGLFQYLYNELEEDNSPLKNIYSELTEYKPSLSKDHILDDMSYFMDISEYEMKDKVWVEERIAELKDYMMKMDMDSKEGILPEDVNVHEAKTVWQNLIWELETVLGMRKSFRSDLREVK